MEHAASQIQDSSDLDLEEAGVGAGMEGVFLSKQGMARMARLGERGREGEGTLYIERCTSNAER
jgi:hypothetical protein